MSKELNDAVNRLNNILTKLDNFIFKNYNGGVGGIGKGQRAPINRKNPQNEEEKKLQIEKNRQIVDTSTALKMLRKSFSSTFNIVEIYKQKIRDVYENMDEQLADEIKRNKQFKDTADDYLKKHGLNNKAIYESSVQFNNLSNVAKKLTNSYDAYMIQQQKVTEQESKIKELQAKAAAQIDAKEKAKINKQINKATDELVKYKDSLNQSKIAFTDVLNNSSSDFSQLSKNIDLLHPALVDLDDVTKNVIKGQKISENQYAALNEQMKSLIRNTENYDQMLVSYSQGISDQIQQFQNSVQASMQAFRASLAVIATSGTSRVIDSVLAQLRFGVEDSNYFEAIAAGLADPELTEVMGTYQAELRSLANDFSVLQNPKIVVDKFLDQTTRMGEQFGLTGVDAAKFGANMMRMTFQMGLGADQATKLTNSIVASAKYAGSLPDEVLEYYQGLADSNILQLMRRDIIDPEERRKAVEQDIAQTLRHGKVMGMTAKQTLEATKKLVEGSRYSTLEQSIRAKLAGDMAISQYGLNIDRKKYSELQEKLSRGVELTGEEISFMNAARMSIQQAAASKIEKTGAQGMIQRQIIESVGQGAIPLSPEDLAAAQGIKQVGIQTAGGAAALDKFMQDGVIPATSKFVEVNASFSELVGKTQEVNNSLALGLEEYAAEARNILRGVSENPILGALGGVGGILGIIGGAVSLFVNFAILRRLKTLKDIITGGGGAARSGGIISSISSFVVESFKKMFPYVLRGLSSFGTLLSGLGTLASRFIPLLAVGTAAYAATTVVFEALANSSDLFNAGVDYVMGKIMLSLYGIWEKFSWFLDDDGAKAREGMRLAQDRINSAQATFAVKGISMGEYVGMYSPEEAKAAKNAIYEQVERTSKEAREQKIKEDEEYKKKMLEAAQKTAENTDKSTKLQEEEKKKNDEKLFSVRSLDDIQRGFDAINSEITNRTAVAMNSKSYG